MRYLIFSCSIPIPYHQRLGMLEFATRADGVTFQSVRPQSHLLLTLLHIAVAKYRELYYDLVDMASKHRSDAYMARFDVLGYGLEVG